MQPAAEPSHRDRTTRIIQPKRDIRPFDIANYDIHKFNPQDRETQKKFYPYFKSRGIDLYTQYAFHRHFCLATNTVRTVRHTPISLFR